MERELSPSGMLPFALRSRQDSIWAGVAAGKSARSGRSARARMREVATNWDSLFHWPARSDKVRHRPRFLSLADIMWQRSHPFYAGRLKWLD